MPLRDFLPSRIATLSARVGEAVAQVHADRFGLTRDEWRVLAAAAAEPSLPTKAVQEATGLDKVAVSRAASALEERGLITRTEDRDDRRIKIVHVSERGRETVRELERIARAREAYLLEALSPDERGAFERAIETLIARAEALGAPETGSRCRPDCEGACERAADFLKFTTEETARPVAADHRRHLETVGE